MERDSTFKDHHFWELQRRDALNGGLSLQIGATTLLIGALYVMSKAITGECSASNIFLIAGAVLTGAALSGTVVCLALSMFGYAYHHVSDMPTYLKDRKHYEAQFANSTSPDEPPAIAAEEALAAFYMRMDEMYANAGGHNSSENQRKNRRIYWTNRLLAFSLILFTLTGLPYLAVTIGADDKPVKVQLLNSRSKAMSEQQKDVPQTPAPAPAAQRKEIQHPPVREPVVCFDHAIPKGDKLKP